MEEFVEFIKDWGYWAVFFGSLIEGESVILTASSMAHFGHLNLYKIMVIAFFGTLIADQTLYLVGHHYGPSIFERLPRLKKKAEKAFVLLHKYDTWFIIACRFIYGIRIISPVVIGAGGVKPIRFIPLNILSALIWTIVSCYSGYWLGDTLEELIPYFQSVDQYFWHGVVGFSVIVIAFILWRKLRKRKTA